MSDKIRIGWDDLNAPQPDQQSPSKDNGQEPIPGKMPGPLMDSNEPSIAERKKRASEYMAPQPPPLPVQAPATSDSPVSTIVTIGIVLLLAWAFYAKSVPSEKACIENVRAAYARIAASNLPFGDKIRHMQAIDTSACPQDFRIAFQDFVTVQQRFNQSIEGNLVLRVIAGGLQINSGENPANVVGTHIEGHLIEQQYWQEEIAKAKNRLAQSAITYGAQW